MISGANSSLRPARLPAQIAFLLLASLAALAQAPSPIDLAKAKDAFAEAQKVSDKDGGRLWGRTLYGPMLLVDPETRSVVANEPDTEGVLHRDGTVYAGKLPANIMIADTPTEWSGKRWTMLRWPLPEDTLTREIEFGHEMFHRIQPELHLDAPDSSNRHLDTAEGRLWLRLEWRALAAALAESGPPQVQAIRDALAFRAHRRQRFPNSATAESSLEIAEGIPEYTGYAAALPDSDSARWRAIAKLSDPDLTFTFVRAFAYTSGPAYGLLLDQHQPEWRKKLTAHSDLGEILASTLPGSEKVSAEQRAHLYGWAAIQMEEADRSAKLEAVKARYRALLVDGPTLTLPKSKAFKFSFNPSTLISLGNAGTVYPTFHASDSWGVLDVKDGALVPADFSRATVAAPADTEGPHLHGPGWTLDLTAGWHLVPASRPGSYTLQKD
ncbi:MAG TPA: hypothetical protein VJ848_11100 [Candidatus Angelobacter sp.]|nr:hypothetical protein [Candidatus Angelobacter sp.]